MRAIPERLRGAFTTRRYTKPRLPLPLPAIISLSLHQTRTGGNCNGLQLKAHPMLHQFLQILQLLQYFLLQIQHIRIICGAVMHLNTKLQHNRLTYINLRD